MDTSDTDSSITNSNDKKFKCSHDGCEAAFSKNSKLVTHIRIHTGERPFVCDVEGCTRAYINSTNLRRHKLSHKTEKREKVPCTFFGCNKEFYDVFAVVRHCARFHDPTRKYKFYCELCEEGFHKATILFKHMEIHTGLPPFKCETCKRRFGTSTELKRHVRTHTVYTCECGEQYERYVALLAHKREAHKIEIDSSSSYDQSKKYRCPIDDCRAAFVKNSKLLVHLNKHTGERPFACDIEGCVKTYANPSHLRRHKATFHDKKSKVPCTVAGCSLEFYNVTNMKRHISSSHNPDRYPYICATCDQGFLKKRLLQKHLYVHTGIKGFECDVCELRFAVSTDLSRHKRTHTVYSCDNCEEKFERWSALLKHKKEKHREATCDECGKKFSNKRTLYEHKKQIHAPIENTELFSCPFEGCESVYLYKRNLQGHIKLIHDKVPKKKIPCPIENCGAMLSRMQCLKKHLDIHKNGGKRKAERATRKDTGIPRKNTAMLLSGLALPENEKNISEIKIKNKPKEETVTSIETKKNQLENEISGLKANDTSNEFIKSSDQVEVLTEENVTNSTIVEVFQPVVSCGN